MQHKSQNEILRYLISKRTKKVLKNEEASVVENLKNEEASMAENLKVNFGNHSTNKKCQTTTFNVASKVTGDGHVLKESSHTTKDKIKGNAHVYLKEAQPEYFQGEHRTEEYEESDAYISVYIYLRKAPIFLQNAIKATKRCVTF